MWSLASCWGFDNIMFSLGSQSYHAVLFHMYWTLCLFTNVFAKTVCHCDFCTNDIEHQAFKELSCTSKVGLLARTPMPHRSITECLPILSWFLNGVGKFIGHAANDWWLQYCTVGCYLKLAVEVHYKVGVYVATYPLPTGKLSLWAFEEHKVWWQGQNKMNTCNWREAFFVDFISYVWYTGHINWVIFMGDRF